MRKQNFPESISLTVNIKILVIWKQENHNITNNIAIEHLLLHFLHEIFYLIFYNLTWIHQLVINISKDAENFSLS